MLLLLYQVQWPTAVFVQLRNLSQIIFCAVVPDNWFALIGGYGTLEELLEVITWAQLGIHKKPVSTILYFFLAPFQTKIMQSQSSRKGVFVCICFVNSSHLLGMNAFFVYYHLVTAVVIRCYQVCSHLTTNFTHMAIDYCKHSVIKGSCLHHCLRILLELKGMRSAFSTSIFASSKIIPHTSWIFLLGLMCRMCKNMSVCWIIA